MRSSTSCSHRYDRFYDSYSDASDCSDVADYGELSDGEIYHSKFLKYKTFSTSEVRNVYNAIRGYNWQSLKYKVLGLVCISATNEPSRVRTAERVPACTEWTPYELKAAKIIEKKFLRARDRKRPYVIKDISIDGGTIDLTVGGGASYSPVTMLQSGFFTKNYLSIINFKFTENGSELSVERTSDGSFNYVVTKGSVVISREDSADAGSIRATVAVIVDANGAVRVTDVKKARERYQRCQMSGVNILISGVSAFEMLCNGRWTRNRDGMYVTNVSDYSVASGTYLDVSDCARGGGGLQSVSETKKVSEDCDAPEALGFGALCSSTVESVVNLGVFL